VSGTNDRQRDEDAEILVDVRGLVLDFTDYLEHDNEEVEKLRKIGDRMQDLFDERYGR
jgi:hypothetical protein